MPRVEIRSLTKTYGDVVAVDDLSLDVFDGEFLTLLGPSGCGKTTTLRCIAGLEKPEKGSIFIGEREVVSEGTFVPANERGIGMVFQSYGIWPHMTVFANIAYPLKLLKTPKNLIKQKVEEILEIVDLEGMGEKWATQLSGGQQQRVALARSLIYQPKLLLFDEPLSNLDANLRQELRFELVRIQKRVGITAIYVTHDQSEALVISDRIALMNKGKIVQIGSPIDIYDRPKDTFIANFLGKSNILKGQVIELSSGCAVVEMNGGLQVHCEGNDLNCKKGDLVCICISPEDLHLLQKSEPKPQRNCWKGRIVRSAYLGKENDYEVSVEKVQIRMSVPSRFPYLREGESVQIYAQPEKCIILAEDSGSL